MKNKIILIIFYSISLLFIITCGIMGYEVQKKNKPFKNYGRYFFVEEKVNDYDLQGCFKAPEDARTYEIKGDSLYYSFNYDVVFEDYYVPINIADQNLCEYGKIYQAGDRIIKLADNSYVHCEKTCRYLEVNIYMFNSFPIQ